VLFIYAQKLGWMDVLCLLRRRSSLTKHIPTQIAQIDLQKIRCSRQTKKQYYVTLAKNLVIGVSKFKVNLTQVAICF